MKTIQLVALLLFAFISLDAQNPRTVQVNTQLQKPKNVEVKKELLEANQTLQKDFVTLESHIQDLSKLNDQLESSTQEYSEELMNLIEANLTPASRQSDLVPVLKEIKRIHSNYSRELLALQDAMNKQAQLMQMMSNIMKSHHDTEKAIIKNMK